MNRSYAKQIICALYYSAVVRSFDFVERPKEQVSTECLILCDVMRCCVHFPHIPGLTPILYKYPRNFPLNIKEKERKGKLEKKGKKNKEKQTKKKKPARKKIRNG